MIPQAWGPQDLSPPCRVLPKAPSSLAAVDASGRPAWQHCSKQDLLGLRLLTSQQKVNFLQFYRREWAMQASQNHWHIPVLQPLQARVITSRNFRMRSLKGDSGPWDRGYTFVGKPQSRFRKLPLPFAEHRPGKALLRVRGEASRVLPR